MNLMRKKTFCTLAREAGAYIEREEVSLVADPVVQYMNKQQLEKTIKETRKRMAKASTQAMVTFYKKHYLKKYPKIAAGLVYIFLGTIVAIVSQILHKDQMIMINLISILE